MASRPGSRTRRGRRDGRSRFADIALSLILLGAVALAVLWLRDYNEAELTGHPRIADGDSLQFGDRRIRLRGIDAPELDQNCMEQGRVVACGRASRAHLVSLVDGKAVECTGNEDDRYGRLLARCRVGEVNLNAAMVRDGWALAYGEYAADEAAARASKRGLWAYSFENPQQWRRAHDAYRLAETEDTGWVSRTLTKFLAWLTSVFD